MLAPAPPTMRNSKSSLLVDTVHPAWISCASVPVHSAARAVSAETKVARATARAKAAQGRRPERAEVVGFIVELRLLTACRNACRAHDAPETSGESNCRLGQ